MFTLRGPAGRSGPVIAVDVSLHGAVAATANEAGRMWDLRTRQEVRRHAARVPEDVAWSTDGSQLAVGSRQGEIRIADRTGKVSQVCALVKGHRIAAEQFGPGRPCSPPRPFRWKLPRPEPSG